MSNFTNIQDTITFFIKYRDKKLPTPVNMHTVDGHWCSIFKDVLYLEGTPFARRIWIDGKPYYSYLSGWCHHHRFFIVQDEIRISILNFIAKRLDFAEYTRLDTPRQRIDFFSVGDSFAHGETIRRIIYVPEMKAVFYVMQNSLTYGVFIMKNNCLNYRMVIKPNLLTAYRDIFRRQWYLFGQKAIINVP